MPYTYFEIPLPVTSDSWSLCKEKQGFVFLETDDPNSDIGQHTYSRRFRVVGLSDSVFWSKMVLMCQELPNGTDKGHIPLIKFPIEYKDSIIYTFSKFRAICKRLEIDLGEAVTLFEEAFKQNDGGFIYIH